MRKVFLLMAAIVLASCSKAPDAAAPADAASEKPAEQAATASTAEGGDTCALVADAATLFGTPVTSGSKKMGTQTACEWKSADGRICGSVTVYAPAYNASTDPKVNFGATVTSLAAFGEVKDVAGIGEEAKMVDGGMLGAQLAFRTASSSGLVASACRSGPYGQVELAQRLAREIAGKL